MLDESLPIEPFMLDSEYMIEDTKWRLSLTHQPEEVLDWLWDKDDSHLDSSSRNDSKIIIPPFNSPE